MTAQEIKEMLEEKGYKPQVHDDRVEVLMTCLGGFEISKLYFKITNSCWSSTLTMIAHKDQIKLIIRP